MAKAKSKSKAKSARKAGKAKKADTARERRPGRRPQPNPKALAKHERILTARIERLNKKEAEVQTEKNALAGEIDAATADDCSTTWICETVGRSRQTIFKLVAERVDGKDLTPGWGKGAPKSKSGRKPSKAKAKAAPKATKAKSTTKATKKSKAPARAKRKVIVGRNADPAGMSKGKGKAKRTARRPLKRPRPKS